MNAVHEKIRALIVAVDLAATAETRYERAKPGYWRSAKARLQELCQLVTPEDIPPDDQLWLILNQDPPIQDPDKPMKGARIVTLYRITGSKSNTYRPRRAAVRKRHHAYEFEAVAGYEDFGTRRGNTSSHYVWETLHGVFDTETGAATMLHQIYGDKLR